jgi:hypothetical protein
MSFLHKRYGRGRRRTRALSGLGGVFDTIGNLISGAGTAVSLAQDPYAPEALCRIQQIQSAGANQAVQPCTDTVSTAQTALGRFIVPLRMVAYAEQNRWVYGAALAVVIGLPLYIGYRIGGKGGS